MQETQFQSLGWEYPLEEMATHSSFCLENPMDRGAWWATVCGVAKGWTQLNTHTHVHKPTRSYGVGCGERSRVGWESARFEFFIDYMTPHSLITWMIMLVHVTDHALIT